MPATPSCLPLLNSHSSSACSWQLHCSNTTVRPGSRHNRTRRISSRPSNAGHDATGGPTSPLTAAEWRWAHLEPAAQPCPHAWTASQGTQLELPASRRHGTQHTLQQQQQQQQCQQRGLAVGAVACMGLSAKPTGKPANDAGRSSWQQSQPGKQGKPDSRPHSSHCPPPPHLPPPTNSKLGDEVGVGPPSQHNIRMLCRQAGTKAARWMGCS